MALKMKKQREAKYFQKRSMGWKASFHPELKLMIPRSENGDWLHTDPLSEKGFVQANAWQATFGLSHDIQGLARMMGGKIVWRSDWMRLFESRKQMIFCSAM